MFGTQRAPDGSGDGPNVTGAIDPPSKDPSPPGEAAAAATVVSADWAVLVERIRDGEDGAMEELYRVFSRGIRYYLCRQLGPQELDDRVHDAFLIVVQAIRRGDLREPERLMGFVRTVVRRQVAAQIDQVVHSRKEEVDLEVGLRVADGRHDPERTASERQQIDLMAQVLREMSLRDREILTRFYLLEQSQEQVCEDMGLSETQFRLLKSRAKARFGEMGRKRLQQNPMVRFILRTSASALH